MKFVAIVQLPYGPHTNVKVEFEMDDKEFEGIIDPDSQEGLGLAYEHAKGREEELRDLATKKLRNFVENIKGLDDVDIEIGLSEVINDFAENAEVDDVDAI